MVQLPHLNVASFKHAQMEGGMKMTTQIIKQANSGTLNDT